MAEAANEKVIRTNCPRDCYDACGIWVRTRNGEIVSVRGDPEHPVNRGSLCGKCSVAYNGMWQSEEARLLHPLRRSGAKGEGRFERVSWDEALGEIAERLTEVVETRGPSSILHTHYTGTLSLLAFQFPMRFFHRLGASEVEPDSICNLAGHVAWKLLFGNSEVGFDPRTAQDASCILVWGANPSHSGPHIDRHWLGEFSGSIVVVDPIRTETAERAALHLQPFPGSDAALAFGLLHVLERDGRFDESFIEAHTLGAGEVRSRLDECTPAWTEQQTGVPAAQIEEAARLYGRGPSLLWAGQGFQRQRGGGNAMRAVGLLPALTGNIGKPGAGFLYLNITPAILGLDFGWLAGASLARERPARVSHMGLAARLEDPAEYRALLSWNTNPLASAADQRRMRRALSREDLLSVVVDCFPTDTADYADYVLPAASFLEFDDLTFSYMNLLIGAQAKAREPLGEALPNMEIFRRLARAMGYEDDALFESDASMLDAMVAQMGLDFDFAELKRRGHHVCGEMPRILHEDLRFETPSGKIEIVSQRALRKGLPSVPQPRTDARPEGGRLQLLSPASKWRLNDSFANEEKLRDQMGPASVILHPEDASRLGIDSGMRVRLHNESGALELEARIEAVSLPGVAVAHKGRWPKLERNGANVNVLHAGHAADMGESTAVHSTEVWVTPVAG